MQFNVLASHTYKKLQRSVKAKYNSA